MRTYAKLLILLGIIGLAGCGDDEFSNTVVVSCEIQGQYLVCQGDSILIPTGPIVELTDPCGDGPGHDEVILSFGDGQYIAWYKNLGLTVLNMYSHYVTTDAQRCHFQVTLDGVEEL